MCEASQGAISATEPVSTLTTPPGRSLVAITSPSVIAVSGCGSLAITTQVLPVTITGATTLTSPSNGPLGATIATTPVGSGAEWLKYGPATALALPVTCAILSAHPAYQTRRSTAASTYVRAFEALMPSALRSSASNCSRRPSSTSAIR